MIKLHEEKGLLPTAFILGAGPCLLGAMSNGTGLGVGMDCVAAVRGSEVAAPCGTEVSLLRRSGEEQPPGVVFKLVTRLPAGRLCTG